MLQIKASAHGATVCIFLLAPTLNRLAQAIGQLLVSSPVRLCDLLCICCSCSGNRSNKTFKPKKNIPEGTHQYDLIKHAAATLGSGNLRLAVQLPEGEDLNEWVAVNSEFNTSRKLHKISRLIFEVYFYEGPPADELCSVGLLFISE